DAGTLADTGYEERDRAICRRSTGCIERTPDECSAGPSDRSNRLPGPSRRRTNTWTSTESCSEMATRSDISALARVMASRWKRSWPRTSRTLRRPSRSWKRRRKPASPPSTGSRLAQTPIDSGGWDIPSTVRFPIPRWRSRWWTKSARPSCRTSSEAGRGGSYSIQRTTSEECVRGASDPPQPISISRRYPADAEVHRPALDASAHRGAVEEGARIARRRVWCDPPRHPVQRVRQQTLSCPRRPGQRGDREAPREDRDSQRLVSRSGIDARIGI